MSPTARSLKYLRDKGYQVAVVERWIAFRKIRVDAFGFGDLLCCGASGIILIQVTTTGNLAARQHKAMALPALGCWLRAGGKFWLHGWAKRGARGERKLWTLTEREIVLEDLKSERSEP